MLTDITRDGEISLDEIRTLDDWLERRHERSQVPAVAWLREVVRAVLLDGRVSVEERCDVLGAIERVLPPDARVLARIQRRAAETISATDTPRIETPAPAAPGRVKKASESQLAYLRSLGVPHEAATLTMPQASELIDQALSEPSRPSSRQIMVLRFWNRLDLAHQSRNEVSDWMDLWYGEDPRRMDAWKAWKQSSGDDGSQGDPDRVPIGAGNDWIERTAGDKLQNATIGMTGTRPELKPGDESPAWVRWTIIALSLGLLALIVYAVMRQR